jgi:AraC-like DNA-binding protein
MVALRYLWGGVASYGPGETFGPELLDDYDLVWIVEGDATFVAEDGRVDAPANTLVLTRPGERELYEWDRRRPTRHAYLEFAPASLPADWPDPGAWPRARPASPAAAALFPWALDRWCSRPASRRDPPPPAVCRMFAALLEDFLTPDALDGDALALELPGPVAAALTWALAELEADPRTGVTLAALASAGGVSPKHLCRLFVSAIGHGPMKTVHLVRLERSVSLLARSNQPIHAVADRCGFASPHHFSRSFRRVYGMPPGAFRERLRRGEPATPSPLPSHLRLWAETALGAGEP